MEEDLVLKIIFNSLRAGVFINQELKIENTPNYKNLIKEELKKGNIYEDKQLKYWLTEKGFLYLGKKYNKLFLIGSETNFLVDYDILGTFGNIYHRHLTLKELEGNKDIVFSIRLKKII